MEQDRGRGGFQGFWIGVRSGGERRKSPIRGEETSMRIRTILLVGAGVLAMCIGPAGAKDRSGRAEFRAAGTHHQARHSHRSMARYSRATRASVAATSASESSDLITVGNNPARRAEARRAGESAVKTDTLYQAGNNPGKRYPSRRAPENAAKDQTLMTNGNNPARKAKAAETTGTGNGDRRTR
jgi:hypothetical protein